MEKKIIIKESWWEDNNLYIKEKETNIIYCFKNAYPTKISFGILDQCNNDLNLIDSNERYQAKNKEN